MDELEIEYGTSMVTEKKDGKERSYEEKIAILHIPESYMSSVEVTASSLEAEKKDGKERISYGNIFEVPIFFKQVYQGFSKAGR